MEAMAAGLPLIATDINGIKDYAEDGVKGINVNLHSADSVMRAIDRVRNDRKICEECGNRNVLKSTEFDIVNDQEAISRIISKYTILR